MNWHSVFFSPISWNNTMNLHKNLDLLLSVFSFLWNDHIYFLQKRDYIAIAWRIGSKTQLVEIAKYLNIFLKVNEALSAWRTELPQMPGGEKHASKPSRATCLQSSKRLLPDHPQLFILISSLPACLTCGLPSRKEILKPVQDFYYKAIHYIWMV